jgi:histidinol dehydrogenase
LSSKGSSTGAATITGWPVSIGGNNAMAAINYWGNITLTALNTVISGSYVSGTTMTLTQTGSAQAASGMDNTMFANTSFLYFTGVYFTS